MTTKKLGPGSANPPDPKTTEHANHGSTGAVGVNTKPKLSFAPLPLDVCCRSDLPSTAKVILARLKLHVGRNDVAFVQVPTLATECGINERSVMRNVAILEERGLLTVDRRSGCDTMDFALRQRTETE